MATRKRFTDPVDVRLYAAQDHLAESRRWIDQGQQIHALWHIMHALLNLQRVEDRTNGSLRNPD